MVSDCPTRVRILMSHNVLEIEDGVGSFALKFSNREFEILGGPPIFIPLGAAFINALGVFENTSVAMDMKIPPGSIVRRSRQGLLGIAKDILKSMQRDCDLLSYNYSFRLTKSEERHRISRQLSGFKVRGFHASVDGWPRGFCTLDLVEVAPNGIGRTVEIIDIRSRNEIETDDFGQLKVYRKDAEFRWPETLEGLIDFLQSSGGKEVTIHHS